MAISNNYHFHIINRTIRELSTKQNNLNNVNTLTNNNNNNNSNNKIGPYYSVTNIPGISEKLRKLFKIYNVNIAQKNIDNIQFLFNNKDSTPRELCNNINIIM